MDRIDTEGLAFEAGLKRGLRIDVPPGERARLEARFAKLRAVVVSAPTPVRLGTREVELVYVARTEEDAEALRDAEAAVLPGQGPAPRDVADRAHRALGQLLGYPACCVEAFRARLERFKLHPERGEPWRSEDYVAAAEAWCATPDARVNNVLRRTHTSLVTFYPCRYDCAAAVAYADAVLGALRSRHGDHVAARTIEALTAPVVLGAQDARAHVQLREGGEILAAQAPRRGATAAPEPRDEALAALLPGRRADPGGQVEGAGVPPPLLFEFRARVG